MKTVRLLAFMLAGLALQFMPAAAQTVPKSFQPNICGTVTTTSAPVCVLDGNGGNPQWGVINPTAHTFTLNGSSSSIQANVTPTLGYSANQLVYSDGSKAQAIASCASGTLIYTLGVPSCSPTLPNGLNTASLTSRGGFTKVSAYGLTPATGAANFGPSAGETTFDFMTYGQIHRVNQNGTINQVVFPVPVLTGITKLQITAWRQQPSTVAIGTAAPVTSTASFDQVGISADLVGSLTAGVNTLAVSIPGARVGDYLGMHVEYSGGATVQNFIAPAASATAAGAVPTVLYSVSNATPATYQYNWKGQTATTATAVLIAAYMNAPIIAMIGDSITSGAQGTALYYQNSYGFCDNWNPTFQLDAPYPAQLSELMGGVTFYNCGISGQTTASMLSRFTTDIVGHHPVISVIMGGVNDIGSGVAAATIQSNLMAMLAAGVADGQRVYVVGILPFSGNNPAAVAAQKREAVNAYLAINVPLNGGTYIDPDRAMGAYYAASNTANNFNLLVQTNDGLHPNRQGYQVLAQLIANSIQGQSATSSFVKLTQSSQTSAQSGGWLGIGITNTGGLATGAPSYPLDIFDPSTSVAQLRISGYATGSASSASAEMQLGNRSTGANIYGKFGYSGTQGKMQFTNMQTNGVATQFEFIANGGTTPISPVVINPNGIVIATAALPASASGLIVNGYANSVASSNNGQITIGPAVGNRADVYYNGAIGEFRLKNTFVNAASNIVFETSTETPALVGPAGIRVGSATSIGFASGVLATAALDTALARNAAGVVEVNNGTAGTFRDLRLRNVRTEPTTVGALPAAATAGAGARGFVTDATACTLNGALTGGGAVACPVHSDGTAWLGG